MLDKGSGEVKYPTGKARNLKKMPDGNPFPYEMGEDCRDGVFDEEVVDAKRGDLSYTPKALNNTGDDGRG